MEYLIDQVRLVLQLTPERWHRLSRGLPVDLLARKPVTTEWSAIECLQHLIDTERVFQFRVDCFLRNQDFPDFDPDSEGTPLLALFNINQN